VKQETSRIRRITSSALTAEEVGAIRRLLWAAFADDEDGAFTEDDWQHSLGGMHFVLEVGGKVASHASVVQRELHVAGRSLRTGYVEAVATDPSLQRHGFGSEVMGEVASYISPNFELGALGTGSHAFYERLGWMIWRGPSYVRTSHGEERTADEDGFILVLPTPSSPTLDLEAPISCEWRPGDVW